MTSKPINRGPETKTKQMKRIPQIFHNIEIRSDTPKEINISCTRHVIHLVKLSDFVTERSLCISPEERGKATIIFKIEEPWLLKKLLNDK